MICRNLLVCATHRDRIWQWQEVEAQSLPRANGSRFAGQMGGALEGRALAHGLMARMRDSTAAPPTKAVLSQQKQGRPRMHLSTTTAQRRQARFHLPLDGIPPQPSSDRRERRVALL